MVYTTATKRDVDESRAGITNGHLLICDCLI